MDAEKKIEAGDSPGSGRGGLSPPPLPGRSCDLSETSVRQVLTASTGEEFAVAGGSQREEDMMVKIINRFNKIDQELVRRKVKES